MAKNNIHSTMNAEHLHVAVIGAGPSGLTSCRHLLASNFTTVCYEQCADIGGTWFHTPALDEQQSNTKPASLAGQQPFTAYDTLHCNLPAKLMSFPDFTFTSEHISEKTLCENDVYWHYPAHYDMLNYLHAYANHFDLMRYVRLNEQIVSVCLQINISNDANISDSEKFVVTTQNLITGEKNSEIFDAVFVCNGHYARPNWPTIGNLSDFKGRFMHCKYYRNPEKQFAGCKKIIIIGGTITGPDLALDIARRVPELELIVAGHNQYLLDKPDQLLAGTKIRAKPDLTEIIGPHSVRFADNSTEHDVDVLIAATGFKYNFPFLSDTDGLALMYTNQRLEPLYQHIVHAKHSKLCFIGLLRDNLGLQTFDIQARYACAMLANKFRLPPAADMLAWQDKDYSTRMTELKWPHHYSHRLAQLSETYHDELVEESGIEPLQDLYVYRIFMRLLYDVVQNPENFREHDLQNL